MEQEELLKSIKSNVKGLVLSEKHGYTEKKLWGHYKEFIGKDLEEESVKLGFQGMTDLLDSFSDIIRRGFNQDGEQVYKGIADESTRHMFELIGKTPVNKKKGARGRGLWRGRGRGGKRGGGSISMRGGPISGIAIGPGQWFDGISWMAGRGTSNCISSNGLDGPSGDAMGWSYTNRMNIEKDGTVMKESKDKVMMVYRLEQILKGKEDGMWSTMVEKQYEKKHKEQLPSQWWEKVDVVRVEPLSAGSEIMIVYPVQDPEQNQNLENDINDEMMNFYDNNAISSDLKNEKEGLEEKSDGLSKELEAAKDKCLASQQERTRIDEKEMHEENNKLSMASILAKNACYNLSKIVNDQKRKIEELEKEKSEVNKGGQEEGGKINKELTDTKAALTRKEQEFNQLKKYVDEQNEQLTKMKNDNMQLKKIARNFRDRNVEAEALLDQLKKDFEDQNEQLSKMKNDNLQLKKIGRNFRQMLTLAEEEKEEGGKLNKELIRIKNDKIVALIRKEQEFDQLKKYFEDQNEQLTKMKNDNMQLRNIGRNFRDRNIEAKALIAHITSEMEKIKSENVSMKAKMARMAEKEGLTKKALTIVNAKIIRVKLENGELQKKLEETFNAKGAAEIENMWMEKENRELKKKLAYDGGGAREAMDSQGIRDEEIDAMKAAIGAQINSQASQGGRN